MTGPLSAVLAEVAAGTPTVVEMARRTGQPETVVRAALDHLVRTGRVESVAVPIGCPPSGCGGCASADGCGRVPGQRCLVTLSLSRRVA
ncbi:FeoC-like transcriptional regulator [Propionicimonas sp.]|uniref:FeoC-like transcriptional regulator n=1 Tax=Propionicimonas sp. TaxID=1955623 RepID=UPI0039E6DE75